MAISYNITNYTDTFTNVVFIDDLTPEIVKRKYYWLFSAIIKDAIIGQNSRGLVWYCGEWLGGEWEDGTWFSGTWHDGIWKNGLWYSWRLDKRQLLEKRVRVIEKENPANSIFKTGVWRKGIFYNGYFGLNNNRDWSLDDFSIIVRSEPRWEDGTFHAGIFRNATWLDGVWLDGYFYNSQWIGGTFVKGVFEGDTWWDGKFSGGDFVRGEWYDGTFTQVDTRVPSRFGSTVGLTGSTISSGITCTWYDGVFNSGEVHSGLNKISGFTYISNNHNRTHFYGGKFNNGKWFGGTASGLTFNNGIWYDGVWLNGTFNNGFWYNGLWLNGAFNNGYFKNGLWKNGIFSGGYIGYEKYKVVAFEKDTSVTIKTPDIAL